MRTIEWREEINPALSMPFKYLYVASEYSGLCFSPELVEDLIKPLDALGELKEFVRQELHRLNLSDAEVQQALSALTEEHHV